MTTTGDHARGGGKPDQTPVTVAVFLSYKMSFVKGREVGFYDREMARYRRMERGGARLVFVTYDRTPQRADGLDDAVVLTNHFRLPNLIFSLGAPFLYWRTLGKADIFLTEQMLGSWTALIAKFVLGRKLVVRMGFLLGETLKERGKSGKIRSIASVIEFLAYRLSDGVISTVPPYGRTKFPNWQCLAVVPNGVDIKKFCPQGKTMNKTRPAVFFVGRLNVKRKNLGNLLAAIEGLDAQLVLVGDGPDKPVLQKQAEDLGIDMKFLGVVPNNDLAGALAKADIFVLPSKVEGSPKALLEAMACGLPVLSSRWKGAQDVVDDGKNGLLCDGTPESLRAGLERLLADPALRRRLGEAARETIVARFSIDATVAQEMAFVREVLAPHCTATARGSMKPPGG